jgi:hypothetical protein
MSLDRIDAALARIEVALRQQQDASAGLEVRHARLREAVGQSLARLDALIDKAKT